MLSDREKFIVIMMTMIISPKAKLLSRKARAALIKLMKNKMATSVTNDDWHVIKMDIDALQSDILSMLTKDAIRALNESPDKMEPELMELEREGKDLLKQVSQEDAEKAGIGDLFKQVKDAYKKSRDWR
jgi:DNA-binding GntR family transcriptional regulator